MKLILLPGNVKTNNGWIDKIKSIFKKDFEIIALDYTDCKSLECSEKDLDYELKKIARIVKNEDNYILLAKTTGIALALKGVYDEIFYPQKCIFIGVPIVWARLNDLPVDKWLKDFWIPSLVFQSEDDPSMCFEELKEYLKQMDKKRYKIVQIPGKGPDYDNFLDMRKPIFDFLEEFKDEKPIRPKYL